MNLKIAKKIAELLNSENQLVLKYTGDKIIENAQQYLYLTAEDDEVKACIECKKVQWYQMDQPQESLEFIT
jgi:hypothetical protein